MTFEQLFIISQHLSETDMRLKVNRSNETVDVLYFLTESKLNTVFAVVEETSEEIKYYHVCIAPFWDAIQNTTVYQMAANPVGENYETGMPSIQKKERISTGLLGGKLDITKNKDDVYFLLTGKRRPAIKTNVIG